MLKTILKELFCFLGFDISRKKPTHYEYLLSYPRYKELDVNLLGKEFRIVDSLSFYWSFREIFLEKIYSFKSNKKAPVILDCGSNCGVGILFFKKKYPESMIFAVEADPRIYEVLKRNINNRNYENITIINKAISLKEKEVVFYTEGADGGRIHPIDNGQEYVIVESISLDDLIVEEVDFLKLDIEGEETDVIISCNKLNKVSNIFIEYHSFVNKEQSLDKILYKLHNEKFRYYIHTQFCSQSPFVKEKSEFGMDLKLNIFAKKIGK